MRLKTLFVFRARVTILTITALTSNVLQSDASQAGELKSGQSVSFLIKKHRFGKEGWKIMPEDESFDIKLNASILAQAAETVRYLHFYIYVDIN